MGQDAPEQSAGDDEAEPSEISSEAGAAGGSAVQSANGDPATDPSGSGGQSADAMPGIGAAGSAGDATAGTDPNAADDNPAATAPQPDGGTHDRAGAGGASGDQGAADGGLTTGDPSVAPTDAGSSPDGNHWTTTPAALGRLNGTPFYVSGSEGEPFTGSNGDVLRQGDTFYWYGGSEDGVTVSSSTDLDHWTKPRVVVSEPASAAQPHVLYNSSLDKYVLYTGIPSTRSVAWSDSPDGDFSVMGTFPASPLASEMAPIVGDDGVAYAIEIQNETGANNSSTVHFWRLTEDYLQGDELLAGLGFSMSFSAPILYKHDGLFYWITRFSSGQLRVATATDFAGPWDYTTVSVGALPQWELGSILDLGGEEEQLVLTSGQEWRPLSFLEGAGLDLAWFNTLEFDIAAGTVRGSNPNVVVQNQESGLVLDTAGSEDGSPVIVATSTGTTSQCWSLSHVDIDRYRLVNVDSDRPMSFGYDETATEFDPTQFYHALLAEAGSPQDTQETYWQNFELIPGPTEGTYQLFNATLGVYLGVESGSSGDAVELLDTSGPATLWTFLAVD